MFNFMTVESLLPLNHFIEISKLDPTMDKMEWNEFGELTLCSGGQSSPECTLG